MSPEEQNLLSGLFERVRTAATTPRDGEAEALIDQAVRAQPSAPYYLSQAVIIQEKGLEAAARHIEDLEAQLRRSEEKIHALEARNDQARSDQAPRESQSGGFLGSLFGSSEKPQPAAPAYTGQGATPASAGPWGAAPRSASPAAPPPPMQQPVQQPMQQQAYGGPWDRQPQQAPAGGGFLRGAMGAAAGVAGGMLLANSLSGIFGNHMSSLGLGGATAAAAPVEETVINNYYGDDAATQAADNTPADAGGWQQADLDTGGDDSFDGGDGGSDDSMNA